MKRKIAISVLLNQVQVGIVEDDRLVEYYLERDCKDRLGTNVYKGRVENVLPGMGAAFVDIGMAKNGFLYLADATVDIKTGDSIMVQVSKEAVGTKGPRVTTKISLPGRYLVLMPFQNNAGVSRQIIDEEERARLREIAEDICPKGSGLIVRTVAEGRTREDLQGDLDELVAEWSRIKQKHTSQTSSPLLYQDYDLVHRILRDVYAAENTTIIVDSPEMKERVETELADLGVRASSGIELYRGKVNLFTYLGLDKELARAANSRVWLDCGGYLIFNQTEALLSIDVNTGKYVGSKNLQDTVLKTNLEAAAEIAHQLRLRNTGGIVVIDFIDMSEPSAQEAVLEQLATNLRADKTRTNLLGFTRLGLVELTRKKTERLLSHVLEVDCPHCRGRGRVLSDETLAFQIAREAHSLALENVEAIEISCHPHVAGLVIGPGGSNLRALENHTGKTISVHGDHSLGRQDYKVQSAEL
ncbi:MAG: Rne/Rng family ribonuclease [Limnochordia bacterium]|jgi:ribonuclease G|nr:Rne/Rng family ribonuclease [Limnochordia bacterium]